VAINVLENRELEERLRGIDSSYRLAFAVWCLHAIFVRWHDYIADRLNDSDKESSGLEYRLQPGLKTPIGKDAP